MRAIHDIIANSTRRSRRGSVLVLVLGAIALLSVLAVVYAAVGKRDRSVSNAIKDKFTVGDTPSQMELYLSRLIAEDALATVRAPGFIDSSGNLLTELWRETWDYPSIDPDARVIPATGDPFEFKFDPRGRVAAPFDPSLPGDRIGSDPWLSSGIPEDLSPGAIITQPDAWFARGSWRQISAVTPSGRPINLTNLRDNFDATHDEMAADLTLFGLNGSLPVPDPSVPTFFGEATDINRPDHWFTYQLFMALTDEQIDEVHEAEDITPGDPRWIHSQYADADGDGVLDARWFEMVEVDLTDPANPTFFNLLKAEPGIRYTFAVKIDDLSGRVNVNTASDTVIAPDVQSPAGSSFAEVDLLRMLRMEDIYLDTDDGALAGYAFLAGGDIFTTDYDTAGGERVAYGLAAYDTLKFELGSGQRVDSSISFDAADIFDNLDDLRNELAIQANAFQRLFDTTGSVDWHADNPAAFPPINGWTLTEIGRRIYAGSRQTNEIGFSLASVSSELRLNPTQTFDESSLLELLAFGGLNDPRVTSPLESAFDGRVDTTMGPMRAARSSDLEAGASGFSYADLPAPVMPHIDPRRRLTTLSKARQFRSLPGVSPFGLAAAEVMPVLSGAPDAQTLFAIYNLALSPASSDGAWLRDATGASLRSLYYGYAGPERATRLAAHLAANFTAASLGESDDPVVFTVPLDLVPAQTIEAESAAGGGVATRSFPSAFGTGDAYEVTNGAGNQVEIVPSLSLAEALLPSDTLGNNTDIQFPVVNVYGPTAQPVVTEIAAYTIYADATISAGGDDEESAVSSPDPFTAPQDAGVTINSDAEATNPDYLFQVLAIQIHNPFDTEVELASDDNPYYIEFAGRFYPVDGFTLEPGGTGTTSVPAFDVPTPATAERPVLEPGETITLAIFSQPVLEVERRIRAAAGFSATTPDDVVYVSSFMSNHLAPDGIESVYVTARDISNGQNLPAPSTIDQSYAFFEPAAPTARALASDPEATSVVRLWRAFRPTNPDETGTTNRRENDILADRMRFPENTDLDRTLELQSTRTAGLEGYEIPGTTAAAEGDGDNRGYTIVTYASVARPSDPDAGDASIEFAWPAYCLEAIDQAQTLNADVSDGLSSLTTLSRNDFEYPSMTGATGFLQDFMLSENDRLGADQDIALDEEPDEGDRTLIVADIPSNLSAEPIDENRIIRLDRLPPTRRIADLFLPMAIGAWHAPDPSDPGNPLAGQRVTLAESLAIAMRYTRITDPDDPMSRIAEERPVLGAFSPAPTTPGFQTGGALDQGRLVLDDFVPFFRANAAAYDFSQTIPQFDETGAFNDIQWGFGTPMALRLLERLRGVPGSYAFGDPLPGLINLNTADPHVLRTIPMLTPTNDGDWWYDDTIHGPDSDIAATLAAMRDKTARQARVTPTSPTSEVLDFTAGTRSEMTGMFGLLDIAGMRSPAEIAYARIKGAVADIPLHSIDRLGDDDESIDEGAIDPTFQNEDDNIADDPFEKAAIIAAAQSSISVSSDTYAVWILIHGYQESDVTGLNSDTPMEPSIARRYLMIVDRSEVTQLGDPPRIVSFTEVPLSPSAN